MPLNKVRMRERKRLDRTVKPNQSNEIVKPASNLIPSPLSNLVDIRPDGMRRSVLDRLYPR